jgi:hypothetical protein
MLEKYAFMSKNLIYVKHYSCSMILMASSHIYFLFFITCSCNTHTHTHTHIYIYILLVLCQNPLDIEFSGGFQSFWNCLGFTRHVRPLTQTCLAPSPNMSESRVSQLYKGDPVPLGTLASFFLSHLECVRRLGFPKAIWGLLRQNPLISKGFDSPSP